MNEDYKTELTKRQKYNLEQAFIRLRRDLDDKSADYELVDIVEQKGTKTLKVVIDFTIKGEVRRTVLFSKELRSIKAIYNVIISIL